MMMIDDDDLRDFFLFLVDAEGQARTKSEKRFDCKQKIVNQVGEPPFSFR